MFDHIDVKPIPGDGVLHQTGQAVVLVSSKPPADQNAELSAWAKQDPNGPLPEIPGVAALGWFDGQFQFQAIGPLLVKISSSSGEIALELGDKDKIGSLSLGAIETVECRHVEHQTEMPDPFETFSSGTSSASGFLATVQTPSPIEPLGATPAEVTKGDRVPEAQDNPPEPKPSEPDHEPAETPTGPDDSQTDQPDDKPAETPTDPDDSQTNQPDDIRDRLVPPMPPQPPSPPKPDPIELTGVTVMGIVCTSCETFNHPDAAYCFVDGHRLVETRVLQRAKRPTLGHLRLSQDGSHVQLLKTVVLGRAPDISPLVQSDEAQGVALDDPSRNLSRSHAVVELKGWSVYLCDDGSQNGTWVVESDGQRRRLADGEKMELTEETMFSVGQSVVTFVPAPLR